MKTIAVTAPGEVSFYDTLNPITGQDQAPVKVDLFTREFSSMENLLPCAAGQDNIEGDARPPRHFLRLIR